MKTVIALLKATIAEYEKGVIADADGMLSTTFKLRQQMLKAESLAAKHRTPGGDRTSEKN